MIKINSRKSRPTGYTHFVIAKLIGFVLSVLFAQHALAQTAQTEDRSQKSGVEIEEVVVTGSFISRKSQDDLGSPTTVLDHERILESGFTGVEDLLVLNPANTGSIGGVGDLTSGGSTAGLDSHSTRSVNLRGLGSSSTLVLLNGRRVASSELDTNQNTFVNIAALVPTIAINSIETVLDGASALYGSDAIAGVMNIITNDSFNGGKIQVQYIGTKDAPGYNLQAILGGSGDAWSGVMAVSYDHQGPLQNGERDATRFNRTSGFSNPGNYRLTSPATVAGVTVGPGTVADPNCVSGGGILRPAGASILPDSRFRLSDGNIVGFANSGASFDDGGSRCRFSFQQTNPLVPETDVLLIFGKFDYNLSPAALLSIEARVYHQSFNRIGTGALPITRATSLSIPQAASGNPFGQDIGFSGRVAGVNGSPLVARGDVDGVHLALSVEGDITETWRYTSSIAYSREDQKTISRDTDLIALQNALNGFGGTNCRIDPFGKPEAGQTAGVGGCNFFSPFASEQGSTENIASGFNILTDLFRGLSSEIIVAEALVSGDLLELPGGTLGLAVGLQYRDEEFTLTNDSGVTNGRFGFFGQSSPGIGQRDVSAVFAELYVPVVRFADVQFAVRYEDYGDFTTTDPKIAINIRPNDFITLRSSYSTAFRAPSILQANSSAVTTATDELTDPRNGDASFRVISRINNPDLLPESSTNFNFGITVKPLEALEISLDYFQFEFENQITLENAQTVINESCSVALDAGDVCNGELASPPAILDANTSDLLGVETNFFNAGAIKTSGLDLRVNYRFNINNHLFVLSSSTSFITTYEVQASAASSILDRAGWRNASNAGSTAPDIRNVSAFFWHSGPHSANLTMRYNSGVEDDYRAGSRLTWGKSGSLSVFDAQYAFRFGRNDSYKIAIGATNLFNEGPPLEPERRDDRADSTRTGFISGLGDALGRKVYGRVEVAF